MGDLWTLANVVAALAVIAFFTGLVWKVANWVRDIRAANEGVASNRDDINAINEKLFKMVEDIGNVRIEIIEVKSDLAAFKKEVRDNFAIVREGIKGLAASIKASSVSSGQGDSGQGEAGQGDALPPDMDLAIEAQSPLGLSDHGVKIAERINAAHIAKKYAHRVELPANASHYEIQQSSLIYAKFDLLKDLAPEDKKEVEDYAYFTGESMNTPLRVIGIMMRNAIFEARGMKIKPYDYPPLPKTPPKAKTPKAKMPKRAAKKAKK